VHVPTDFPTLGDWAYLAIARAHRQLRKDDQRLRTEFAADEVHDIRATLRRIRFLLEAYGPAIRLPGRFDPQLLADFASTFGKLRDYDIMLETLERCDDPAIPAHEREAAAMLHVHIRHLRHRPLRRVARMIDGRPYRRTVELLGGWVNDPVFRPAASLPILSAIPDLLLPSLSALWLDRGWFITLGGTISSRAERRRERRLHALRRCARRVRYLVDPLLPFYSEPVAQFVEDLVAMQDALGRIQDDTLLPDYVEEHFKRPLSVTLPHFVQHDMESRRRAMIVWEQMRRRYLSPTVRAAVRAELLKPAMPAKLPKPYRKLLESVPLPYFDLRA
jgi:CHAD domain-containing protein